VSDAARGHTPDAARCCMSIFVIHYYSRSFGADNIAAADFQKEIIN